MTEPKLDWMPLDRRFTEAELAMCECRVRLRKILAGQYSQELELRGMPLDPVTECFKVARDWSSADLLPAEVKALEEILKIFNISLKDLAHDSNVNTVVPAEMASIFDYIGKPIRCGDFLDAMSQILCDRIYAGRVSVS